MKISFPHMGNNWICFKAMTERLDFDTVLPPPITRRTIELGVRHSPESVCFPFKLNLGNFIEALERGATTLVMAGGNRGSCRFQNYSHLQNKILTELGYSFRLVVLDTSNLLSSLFKELRPLNPQNSNGDIIKAFLFMCVKARALGRIENLRRYKLPREAGEGETEQVAKESLDLLDEASSFTEVKRAGGKILRKFRVIPEKNINLIKIAIVGEIYTVSEPAMNLDIEKGLSGRGVWVHNPMSFYKWLMVLSGIDLDRYLLARRARPYLRVKTGGEDQQSLGNIIKFSKKRFDGAVFIHPFGCLPENVAMHALKRINEKYKIPLLCLSQDEHTSREGVETRLDAFVDMIKRRKPRR